MTQRLYALFEKYPAVTTDSRQAGSGTLFFALRGDRFDGNRFALAALDAGAACAVVDDPAVAASAGAEYAGRLVVVDDALAALQALARNIGGGSAFRCWQSSAATERLRPRSW